MTSSATSRLRLDFHHIKVDFKKSEVVQPLRRGALEQGAEPPTAAHCSGCVHGVCVCVHCCVCALGSVGEATLKL